MFFITLGEWCNPNCIYWLLLELFILLFVALVVVAGVGCLIEWLWGKLWQ